MVHCPAVSASIVLIGSAEALPQLRDRLGAGPEVQTFTDAEALEALDHIIRRKPAVVALDRDFSATSRGTALINRIKDDPALAACDVRVVAPDAELQRVAAKRSHAAAVAVDEPAPPLDQRGTRRAPRVRMRDGVEVAVDGTTATLVDLSIVGAQVVSPSVLKPNQRVRVVMGNTKSAVRCNGSVAWAAFELPKGLPSRYRAGIDFTVADAEALAAFAERHKRS